MRVVVLSQLGHLLIRKEPIVDFTQPIDTNKVIQLFSVNNKLSEI